MTLIYSFLFCGLVCLLAQIMLDNTTFTPGHLTSILTVVGSILGCFNIYEAIINKVGTGASIMIINFGNSLTNAAYEGYLNSGFIGLFKNMLTASSLIITSTVIISFFITLFTKAKD